jgi:hypothetical protein
MKQIRNESELHIAFNSCGNEVNVRQARDVASQGRVGCSRTLTATLRSWPSYLDSDAVYKTDSFVNLVTPSGNSTYQLL